MPTNYDPIGDAYRDATRRTRGRRPISPLYQPPVTATGTGDPNAPPPTPDEPPEPAPTDDETPDTTKPPEGQTQPIDEPTPTWGGRDTATPYTAAEDRSTWDSNEFDAPAYTAQRYNPQAVSGYDVTKWNSPTHQTPKYVVGRILSGYDLNDPAQLEAAIGDVIKAYPGTKWLGGDLIDFPGEGVVDIIRDFGGESGIAWQPKYAQQAAAPAAGAAGGGTPAGGTATPISGAPIYSGGAGAAAGSDQSSALDDILSRITESMGAGNTTSTTTATSGTPVDPELDAARRAAILELLGRKPPTAAELQATPENQAYQLQAQRAMERDRAELAERAGYEGFGDSGYFETQLGGLRQERAEGEASFLGQLSISRLNQQREDVQFGIQQAQQSGQFDLAHQLDQQRMLLDAAIEREQLDLDRARQAESARQFNNRLGYDYAGLQLDANRDAAEFGSDYV